MEIIRVKKTFEYNGIKLRICAVLETYMNAGPKVEVTRVVAPNDGIIPVNLIYKEKLKNIQAKTVLLLDGFKKRGCDVVKELTE